MALTSRATRNQPKTHESTVVEPTPEEIAATVASETDPWAALDTAEYSEAFTLGSRIDVDSIPQAIRNFVEKSYADYFRAFNVNGTAYMESAPKYKDVTFANAELAKVFVNQCHRYAKVRPDGAITVRAVIAKEKPRTVHVAAMPKVVRARLTGEEKAKREADKAKKAAEKAAKQ